MSTSDTFNTWLSLCLQQIQELTLQKLIVHFMPSQLTYLEEWRLTQQLSLHSFIDLNRLVIQPTIIKQECRFTLTFETATQHFINHLAKTDLLHILPTLAISMKQAVTISQTHEHHIKRQKANSWKLHSITNPDAKNTLATPLPHNREKHYLANIQDGFWFDLGVSDQHGKLLPSMSKKWKQINQFLAICQSTLSSLTPFDTQPNWHIVDFGSGKGYLTFALHQWLTQQQPTKHIQTTGIELRHNLVRLCQDTVKKHHMKQLDFFESDVAKYQPSQLNMMIALHACDTATDYAIHTGIRLNADVIMVAPCCHKEFRPQLQIPPTQKTLLQHGIHQTQFCDMLTDSIRANLMEAHGYTTKVIEFVSQEHTQKNKMIIAVKNKASTNEQLKHACLDLYQTYGIREHTLWKLLYPTEPTQITNNLK